MIKATGINTGGVKMPGNLASQFGQGTQRTAAGSLGAAAELESERINTNKAIKQQNISGNVSMGATIGGVVGSFFGPGYGTLIGSAVGGLIGRAF